MHLTDAPKPLVGGHWHSAQNSQQAIFFVLGPRRACGRCGSGNHEEKRSVPHVDCTTELKR